MNKEEAKSKVEFSNKKNQEAIVKLILNEPKIKRLVHQIPGGATLNETQNAKTLNQTIYNWLRIKKDFERFEISLVGDYEDISELNVDSLKPRRKSLEKFGSRPPWRSGEKNALAEKLSQYLTNIESPMSIIVDLSGIYVIEDSTGSFSPENELWNPVLIVSYENKK